MTPAQAATFSIWVCVQSHAADVLINNVDDQGNENIYVGQGDERISIMPDGTIVTDG